MLAEIRHKEGVIVIRPTGRLIGAANVEIRQQIHEELEEFFDSPKVIFNLEEVTRMDSSGLGTLVSFMSLLLAKVDVLHSSMQVHISEIYSSLEG